ncbi:hypothetical protein IIC68_01760, partial [archaeon]|nr:hypothetical protein [archaeon]
MPPNHRKSVSKPKRVVEKTHIIQRIEDSKRGRKRFQIIEDGERYSERRVLTDRIIGPDGLKIEETFTGPSKKIHNAKGY